MKAVVGQMFLNQSGYETVLCIGVRREGKQRLEAHAWLEHDDRIVIGNLEDLSSFVSLPPISPPL